MAYYEEVFVAAALEEELLEVLLGGLGGEGVGEQDLGLVAGLGADEGGGLEAALEGARDDEIELYLQCIQDVREMEAVAFAVFVEGAFEVEEGIFAADACAGVAENEEIHRPGFHCRTGAFSVVFAGQDAVKSLQAVDKCVVSSAACGGRGGRLRGRARRGWERRARGLGMGSGVGVGSWWVREAMGSSGENGAG